MQLLFQTRRLRDRTAGYFAFVAKHPNLSAVLVLVLVLHVCFLPFIWGNKTLLASSRGTPNVPSVMPDGAWYGQPQGPAILRANDNGASAWMIEADAPLVRYQYLVERNMPLWNPYQSYGAPLAADMQSQPFDPLFLLFAAHPGPRTYNLFVLFRLLIAGLGAYLYLRLFLPFAPSLAGGIVCMLSGYYLLFFNMPHLSVETLVPAVFLATERLLRRRSTANVLLAVLVVFLSIVGGMPESTLLVLTFGYLYFLFRIISDRELRAAALGHLKYFVGVNVVGFALAAFLLMPFLEFMRVAFDSHQLDNVQGAITGLRHDLFGLSIFTYVTPLIFGTTWGPIAPGLGGYNSLRGFFGILPLLFGVVAVGSLWHRRESFAGERRLTAFFVASVALILLKRYGAPVINSVGSLPFYQLVWFPKYEEPLLAFAIAVLCALGVDQVLKYRAGRLRLTLSLLCAFLVLAGIVAFSFPAVRATGTAAQIYYLSIGGAAAVLFIATLVLLGPGATPGSARAGAWRAAAILAVLTAEMGGNFIFPVYHVLTRSATDDTNPYRGAPYLDYLKSRISGHARVFGSDGILHPGWAGAFQVADIRGLDAMYWKKYLPFVQSFWGGDSLPGLGGDLRDRFTGMNGNAFETTAKRRLLQLSSVKYLLSKASLGLDSPLLGDIITQSKGRLTPGREKLIEGRRFTIGGETKAVLYEHPLYERLPFTVEITPARQRLFFSVAMQPAVYDGSMPMCGDGVEFRLEVRDSSGRIALLYSRYIDPKHNPAERRWIPESVDLSRYTGQTIELLFTTTPGPAGNSCMDWAGWGDPHFQADSPRTVFRLLYDHEIKIYEYPDVLPRAALFSNVEVAADERAVLARLVSPSLDIFETAVVSAPDAAAIQALAGAPRKRVQAARIVSYSSQAVEIDASPEGRALLVLNDSNYPGWKVYVDDRPSNWITANYLFRGVILTAGRHRIRFVYRPASFTAGAAIAGTALVCLIGFVVWQRKNDHSMQ